MVERAGALAAFNEGATGPGSCDEARDEASLLRRFWRALASVLR
jgi:hypothetical protein